MDIEVHDLHPAIYTTTTTTTTTTTSGDGIRIGCTIGVPRILQWRGLRRGGMAAGLGDKSPSRAQGQSPGRGPRG